jgi:hypothetical protein
VEDETELTFEIHLHCSDSSPDITISGEDISSGSASISRAELFGSTPRCGACLDDLSLSICLVVRHGAGRVMSCIACPEGCDGETISSSSGSSGSSGGMGSSDASSGNGGSSGGPDGSSGSNGSGGGSGGGSEPPPPSDGSGSGSNSGNRCDGTITMVADRIGDGYCSEGGTIAVGVSATLTLTDCDCSPGNCAGFWHVNGQMAVGNMATMEGIFEIPCPVYGQPLVITVTFDGAAGAVQGLHVPASLPILVWD